MHRFLFVLLFVFSTIVTGCQTATSPQIDDEVCSDSSSEEQVCETEAASTEPLITYESSETTICSDPETSEVLKNTIEPAEIDLPTKEVNSTEEKNSSAQESTKPSTFPQSKPDENKIKLPEDQSVDVPRETDLPRETNQPAVTNNNTASIDPPDTETEYNPSIDISTYIEYAIMCGREHGLIYDSSTTACWDNPIIVGTNDSAVKRDIKELFDWYQIQGFTMFSVWAEERSDGKHDLFIGYA